MKEIIERVIEIQKTENKPFKIQHTIAGGLRKGTWTLFLFQGKYVVLKMDDTNRVLATSNIDITIFSQEVGIPA